VLNLLEFIRILRGTALRAQADGAYEQACKQQFVKMVSWSNERSCHHFISSSVWSMNFEQHRRDSTNTKIAEELICDKHAVRWNVVQ
jgi:hypothetical protein